MSDSYEPGRMQIASAIDEAVEQTKRILFRPFDAVVWLSVGLVVFLAYFGTGRITGYASNFQNVFRAGAGPGGGPNPFEEIWDWIGDNRALVLLIGALLLVLYLTLSVLFLWLQSRARMVLIRFVYEGRVRMSDDWRQTRIPAHSMFRFRLALFGLYLLATVVLLGGAGLTAYALYGHTDQPEHYVYALLPWIAVYLAFVLVYALAELLLHSFVAPLMYLFGEPALAAWSRFGAIGRDNAGAIILYLLIRFAYFIPKVFAEYFICCVTCCIGALPFVRETILSPFWIFDRGFSIFLLASLGPEYRSVPPEPGDEAATYAPPPLLGIMPAPPPSSPDEEPPTGHDAFENPFKPDEDEPYPPS